MGTESSTEHAVKQLNMLQGDFKSSIASTCGHVLHLPGIGILHSSSKQDIVSKAEADVRHGS